MCTLEDVMHVCKDPQYRGVLRVSSTSFAWAVKKLLVISPTMWDSMTHACVRLDKFIQFIVPQHYRVQIWKLAVFSSFVVLIDTYEFINFILLLFCLKQLIGAGVESIQHRQSKIPILVSISKKVSNDSKPTTIHIFQLKVIFCNALHERVLFPAMLNICLIYDLTSMHYFVTVFAIKWFFLLLGTYYLRQM